MSDSEEEAVVLAAAAFVAGHGRQYWVHPTLETRDEDSEFVRIIQRLKRYPDRFYNYFHVPLGAYQELLEIVTPLIEPRDTNFRKGISAEQRFAVTLRFLATGDSFRTIAFSFVMGESTIGIIVRDTCKAIWEALQPVYMPTPDERIWRKSAEGFSSEWQYPHCCGSIDGKHIRIQAPPNSGSMYFNYKGYFSLILLAVVNWDYTFTTIDVGSYGSNSDGGIFATSTLGRGLNEGTIGIPLPEPIEYTLEGVVQSKLMNYSIVGDAAFPLKPYLMRPYPGTNKPEDETIFNYRLSRARRVVENAFGILANKFRLYHRLLFIDPEKVDLAAVMTEVRSGMSADDPVFLGFLAPLSYMTNLYRWGTIPPTDKEGIRTTLHFPEALWMPFSMMNDFWQVVQRVTTFGLIVCNCCFEDPKNPDKPTNMRFSFNYDPEIVQFEKDFFISVLNMDNVFCPALLAVREYLSITEAARKSINSARKVLELRIELLNDIRKQFLKVSHVFTNFMKDNHFREKLWQDYIQAVTGWNINGIKEGATGSELLTLHCMDEFLGTFGNAAIYKGGLSKRQAIPIQYNCVLESLHNNGHEYRFCSFLGHPEKHDPVQKAKDEVIQVLYIWRLGHAKAAPVFLRKSQRTSGGSIDLVLKRGENLATRGEFELRERARETAAFLTTRNVPRVVHKNMKMNIEMKDEAREQELEELLQNAGHENLEIDNQERKSPAGPNHQSYLFRVYSLVTNILSRMVPWY